MDKIAQSRGILNKLREMTNVSGIAAEKFFNPQFESVMNGLRIADSNIRSIVSGKVLEGGDPGADTISMKQLLQEAKSNLNRREFMRAVAELGRFHKKLNEIRTELDNLGTTVDSVHHDFLFQDLGDDHKQELESLRNRWAAERAEALRKEAGIGDTARGVKNEISDFFHNLVTDKGRAMAFYEKRYPRQVGKLKRDTSTLLARSNALLTQVLSLLKEMATARATRNVDNYVRAGEKLKRNFEGYDRTFQTYYNENVKGFLDKIELSAPTKKVPERGVGNQEVTAPSGTGATTTEEPGPSTATPFDLINKGPTTQVSPRTQIIPPGGPSGGTDTPTEYPGEPYGMVSSYVPGAIPQSPRMPTNVGPNIPQRDTLPVGEPPEMEERYSTIPPPPPSVAQPRALPPMLSHSQFYASLEALEGESPLILASIIRKYAKSIQSSDPTTAIQLLKIASNIGS